jgi:hypothetical protein
MKTKEEIEQLAFLKYPRVINDNPLCRNPYNPMEDDNDYERKIWIDAYTKCQEDNKDKKYTEEDLRKAVRIFFPLSVDDIVKLDKYINSLNKQD